jgi:hypothetical protein
MQERGRWETLRAGKVVVYRPPKSYDGQQAVTIEDELEVVKAKPSVWVRIVEWCEARKLNPEQYIRQCFKLQGMQKRNAPEPGQLLGDTYYNKWKETRGSRAAEIKLDLAQERGIAIRHLNLRKHCYQDSDEAAQLEVIVDGDDLGLSPLFRYCLAVSTSSKNAKKLARRLIAEAVLQFECERRLYKLHWAEVLPKGFSKLSARLYPCLLGKLWEQQKRL